MDRHHGFVAALGPEPAGGAARDERSPGEQRHDAAAALGHLHTKGKKTEEVKFYETFHTQKRVINSPIQTGGQNSPVCCNRVCCISTSHRLVACYCSYS